MPFDFAPDDRQQTGLANYHSGLAAEESVARFYEQDGARILCRRWRGKSGEIDLVAHDGDSFLFIEVKKSRSLDAAAHHLSERQLSRICTAANEYLASEGHGLSVNVRIDLAMVDDLGRTDVLRNISLF